jgi:Ca2+-binding RTX toxin-like protein
LLAAESGSYALTGTDVTLTYQTAGNYTLTADSGSYTLSGTDATLKVSRVLTAEAGTYALTGTDVTLSRGRTLTAESGAYAVTGTAAAFSRTYVLGAESGAYTLTGNDAGLTWSAAPVVDVPTHGGASIYGKPVFREAEFRREYEREVSRIENERIRAIQMREDEEIVIIMAALAA